MIKVDILNKSEEAKYEKFLLKCDYSSCQSSLEWSKTITALGKDEPYFLIAKKNDAIVGALPLYYYKCKQGNLLTSIAFHTISGITCIKNSYNEVFKALVDYSLDLGKELDCVAVSFNTNPFSHGHNFCIDNFKPDYIMENFVQYIRLNEIFDEKGNVIHPNYLRRTNLSRTLRRIKRKPLLISEEQTESNVEAGYKIHEKRSRELGATPIPRELFDSALRNLTTKGKGQFLFAFYNGKMISECLFLYSRTTIDMFMMSMDSDYKRLGTNYRFTDYILRWAYDHGISVLSWMSAPRKNDGVYRWKQQFGSHEATFYYLTKIIGDITPWKKMSYRELSEVYKFHYLLPFNLLKGSGAKYTTKDELTSFCNLFTNQRSP
ncbi:MAG: GNAT family N-acetyltransferase [Promethearchaeota archaeon]